MESYRPQLLNRALLEHPQNAGAALGSAALMLRRLIPFPSSGDALDMPLLSTLQSIMPASPATAALPLAGSQQAATVISEAAGILDEEMARGVLAARGVNRAPDRDVSDSSSTLLRQVHDLIDRAAEIWPMPQAPSSMTASESTTTSAEYGSLPVLAPASSVRPGERAVIAMTLRNEESRPVCLAPAATDLLGSAGGCICSKLLEFAAEIRLEPGEQKEMTIAATIPIGTKSGCYSGILVVGGVDYLRALISIEVG
ncbi:MAG: hypothetical protein ACRD2I_18535 [Vicinamibacterales bacterium]